ncbi:hypothetical protein CA54_52840 [Symmachiella macrocystis]|uniref:DUF4878 domain-containing protein n=1 Tax=Symmachiella macrocystis TaxID=2527985 RepID=A0A5C6B5M6_9PLAN|nr:hypothetical protein [Symmachiella macrocystis]TWU06882.1 hypothetical protein CA54_52840 [Symmachiella macrocystis]
MKAQTHGNVSAVETCRRSGKIVFRIVLLTLFAIAGLGYYVYYLCPPKDQNGNVPGDSVRKFLEFAEAENYESARELWYGPAKLDVTVQTEFEDYCARYKKIGLKKFKISWARRGKAGFWMVRIDFEEGGEKIHQFFALKIVDGEWRLSRGYRW